MGRTDATGWYTFSVEVVGRTLFALDGKIVLNGTSSGIEQATFQTRPLHLFAREFYTLSLQYAFDPESLTYVGQDPMLTATRRIGTVQRHLRLLWSEGGKEPTLVPPSAFYQGFSWLPNFPRYIEPTNDPTSCASGAGNEVNIRGVAIGEEGVIMEGSATDNYNPNLHCMWAVQAVAQVR